MNGRRLMMGSALLAGLGSTRLSAIDFTVNSTADVHDAALDGVCETATGNGICTLRAAVEELNVADATPRRAFLPALTFVISQGQLSISRAMLFQGAGMDATFVGAQVSSEQRFMINSGGLTLRDTTIKGFHSGDVGGAILSNSDLVIERCRFENNSSAWGGVIFHSGAATISDSIFSFNSSEGSGGAIASQGRLLVERSVFQANSSEGGFGGAIGGAFLQASNGSAIHSSLFVANEAESGGALEWYASGSLEVVNSTFHANRARTNGGAIFAQSGPVRVINSTLTENVANSDVLGSGTGGGIYYFLDGLELSNSILAGNLELYFFDLCQCGVSKQQDCAGDILSNGFNIIETIDGCSVTGASLSVDPLLLPLAYYGGATRSREPGPTSPARNAGMPLAAGGCFDTLGAPLATDQRGAVRPYGSGECDLGAVERGAMMFRDGFED